MDSGSDDEGSMWSRAFTFGKDVRLRVEEEWGLGIGGTVWEGGVLLARYLSSPAFDAEAFRGARCIELGAGITGLPSLALAHRGVCSQILVTDIEECTPALAANLAPNLPPCCRLTGPAADQAGNSGAGTDGWDLPRSVLEVAAQDFPIGNNRQTANSCAAAATSKGPCSNGWHTAAPASKSVPAENGTAASDSAAAGENRKAQDSGCAPAAAATEVTVSSLDWRQDTAHLRPPFELLLVADVVYIEELMQPLLECMHALSSPASTVLLAFYRRSEAATEAFWRLLPRFFACSKIPEAAYGAPAHPPEVGLFLLRRL